MLAGSSDSTDTVNDARMFPGRMGRKVGVLIAMATFLTLLFGAIPLFLSQRILRNSELFEELSNGIHLIDKIQAATHELEGAFEDRAVHQGETSKKIYAVSEKLVRELDHYAALHHPPNNEWKEKGNERYVFDQMKEHLMEIIKLASAPAERLEEIKNRIRALTPEFTAMLLIHQRAADKVIAENRIAMKWIFSLYYVLIFIGILFIFGGTFWVSRSILRPLKRLASASREIANGNFSNRVEVISTDEIGQLTHSFNHMAACLEEHEHLTQKMTILEERERLAREMHDGLAQNIAFLNLKIAQLERMCSDDSGDKVQEEIQSIRKSVDVLYLDVRQAIFDLRFMVSNQLEFLPMLTEYIQDFIDQTGIRVDLLGDGKWLNELLSDVRVQLFRIIQEALTNVRKHALASRVTVTFRTADGNWEVVIEDNGSGISQGQALPKGESHFGLQTMAERARSVGGSLEVCDVFPCGTRVTIILSPSSVPMEARRWTG